MNYLEIEGLTKRFKKETVLKDISLSVESGETMAIFGPSGVGKTVLLRLIAGVMALDEGEIRIEGKSLTDVPPEERCLAMAFQNFALYPHLSAFDNIASPLRAEGKSANEIEAGVMRIARLLKIDHVLGQQPKALSNGQKQRTSLARALVRGPRLLLLDDPLRNVDAKLRYEMRIELPRLLRETEATVLYVTQDYKEAMALGDRIAVLTDKGFTQVDTPKRIYKTPVSAGVARLFGDPTLNLFVVMIDHDPQGASVDLFGRRWPLPPRFADLAGRDCLIGLRPEHVTVTSEPERGAIDAQLEAITPLNIRLAMLLKTASGDEVLASCSEARTPRLRRGHQQVFMRFDPEDFMIFDRKTGTRIEEAAP